MFHSLRELNAAVQALLNPDGAGIQVVRVKDRINEPLDSGYRDVLLNLKVAGSDMVMELQLHLRDIVDLKEIGHRTVRTCVASLLSLSLSFPLLPRASIPRLTVLLNPPLISTTSFGRSVLRTTKSTRRS